MRNKFGRRWVTLLLFLFIVSAQANPDVMARARALLDQGKATEAYAILLPLEVDMAGNIDFDYLLGVAALDAGRYDKATLALERVLAINPNFAGARLDFARAYFALGNLARAKAEFELVLKSNPPPPARAVIDKYLSAIDHGQPGRQVGAKAYVEAFAGYDTNVNNSTSESQVFVPLFGATLALSPTNVKTSDAYLGAAVGGQYHKQLNTASTLYVAGDLKSRRHFDASEFDTINAEGRFGASFTSGANSYNLGLQIGRLYLDGETNRNLTGLTAEWRRAFAGKQQLGVFGQYSRLRYPDPSLEINDVNQGIVGTGWMRVLGDNGRTMLFGSLYGGTEKEINGRPDGDKRFGGLRAGGQIATAEKRTISLSFGLQTGTFSEQNLAFLVKRKDTLYDLTLGYALAPAPGWTLKPQVMFSRNSSNVPIYDYTRTDISVSVRRDFQ